jgi:enoyl-CoA hydratase/carnithine racemase
MVETITTQDVLFNEVTGQHHSIGVITLNRPAVLNALNLHMIRSMYEKLNSWAKMPQVKAVMITGSGDRAFCAGGDIRLTYELHQKQDKNITAFFEEEYRLNSLIFHYPKPYIAFLNGITMGGGVGISIHGSHRIATERLSFAMPETGIGLFPDVGGTYFLPRLQNHMGYYLGLTGNRINADDCMALNITQHNVSSTCLNELVTLLANHPFKNDLHAEISQLIEQFAIPSAPSTLMEQSQLIDEYFAGRTMEAIVKKLASTDHTFLQEIVQTLQKKSPTSLKITLAALLKGATLSFDACMQQEYRLVSNCLKNHDFFEGVRALIIDKDQKPVWQPETLEKVTEETVQAYF